uniref:Leucine-rich repeat-containing N-terminal plant-type domain-containing protein n=1 Tax=Fagus sylvatica TaxID=28930 RepID=A0A2N9J3F7_FAGSY
MELDVLNNRLFDNVPSFRNGVKVSIDGNPDIGKDKSSAPSPRLPGSPTVPGGGGGDSPASGEKKSKIRIIVGVVIGVVGGLLLVGAAVFCLLSNKKKRYGGGVNGGTHDVLSPRSNGPGDIHVVEARNMVIFHSSFEECHQQFHDPLSYVPGGTCDDRVNALLSVIEGFGYLKVFADNWPGNDPCDSWNGIVCLCGSKVSVVNFSSMGLSGTISPNFSLLPSITKLILFDNFITGTIPTELTKLPNLVELDVSNNRLFGNVPSFRNGVKVSIDGNLDIGKDKSSAPSPSTPGSPTVLVGGGDSLASGEKKSKTGIIVGAVIGVVGGLLLVRATVFRGITTWIVVI